MWVDGLLPDNAQVRDVWATRNHASSTRPIDLLATDIGADCAGAVQFFPAGAGTPQRSSGVQALTDRDIADWIRRARRDWSTWGGEGNLGQFSLGGAQAKCALHFDGRQWGLPCGDTPTTHILKPGLDDYEDAEIVEHICMAAARHLGLAAAEKDYTLRKSSRPSAWERTARSLGIDPDETADRAMSLLQSTPAAISDMIDALDPRDRTSSVLPQLHRQSQIRSADVRREFQLNRKPATKSQQATAAQATVRVVLCGASTATGSCQRRLVHQPCPLHSGSPGSRAILERQPPSAAREAWREAASQEQDR